MLQGGHFDPSVIVGLNLNKISGDILGFILMAAINQSLPSFSEKFVGIVLIGPPIFGQKGSSKITPVVS